MNSSRKEIFDIIDLVEDRLMTLKPENVSRLRLLDLVFLCPNDNSYNEQKNKFREIKLNDTYYNLFEPTIKNIFTLYNELKILKEVDYLQSFNDRLKHLQNRSDNSKVYNEIIDNYKQNIDCWILPKKEKGLYLGKLGTYEIIEFLRNDVFGLVELMKDIFKINDYPNANEKPIFSDELLTEFYKAFNKSGELWEKIELIPFIESWRGKDNKIKIKNKCTAYFCFAVGCIEGYRNKELYPNMDDFMQKTFNISDYKGRKRENPKKSESSTSKKQYAIKRKMDAIKKQNDLK